MRYQLRNGLGELEIEKSNFNEASPTLIFLHDSLGCIELWRDFPKKLAQVTNCNYLVYDRWGYGKSSLNTQLPDRPDNYLDIEADILNELIEALSIPNPILFGHSDGGTIALITGAKYANTIKAIITEGAHIFVEDITLNGILEAKEAYRTTNLKDKLYKYHTERTPYLFEAWTETWLRPSYRNWNIEHILKNITCPSLIIQGEKDEFGTLKQVDQIINQVSGKGERLILKTAGHSPHKEALAETLEACVNFIQKLKKSI
ncbi:MAG: alpha/beta hydrolase [Flavobacteriales bacterium]|jgi:pimeloyl-ACP methyl ester carboxylesterase|nr:alpha/beta hydrolase [Flavobacteriales bacterium]